MACNPRALRHTSECVAHREALAIPWKHIQRNTTSCCTCCRCLRQVEHSAVVLLMHFSPSFFCFLCYFLYLAFSASFFIWASLLLSLFGFLSFLSFFGFALLLSFFGFALLLSLFGFLACFILVSGFLSFLICLFELLAGQGRIQLENRREKNTGRQLCPSRDQGN